MVDWSDFDDSVQGEDFLPGNAIVKTDIAGSAAESVKSPMPEQGASTSSATHILETNVGSYVSYISIDTDFHVTSSSSSFVFNLEKGVTVDFAGTALEHAPPYLTLQFPPEASAQLVRTLREVDFEPGVDTEADRLFRQALSRNPLYAKEWINQLFLRHTADIPVTIGILRIIAHVPYEQISPQGPTIAIASLSHKDTTVIECAIRALENWGHPDLMEVLENFECKAPWLNEYLQNVIGDYKRIFGKNELISQKV